MPRKDAARQRRKMQERSAAEVRAIEEERAQQCLDCLDLMGPLMGPWFPLEFQKPFAEWRWHGGMGIEP